MSAPENLPDVVAEILDTAAAGLTTAVDRTAIVPGLDVAWDACCGGFLYARINEVVPRRSGTVCTGYSCEVAVGVLRCVATLDDNGNAPSADVITADGRRTITDMTDLLRTLPGHPAVNALTEWQPLGPEGACAGGEWGCEVVLSC